MKIIITKEDTLEHVATSVGNMVENKYYYIPGWFEKLEDGSMQFHHMNNLPKELTDTLTALRKETKEPMVEKK